jgi:hypothetical protein
LSAVSHADSIEHAPVAEIGELSHCGRRVDSGECPRVPGARQRATVADERERGLLSFAETILLMAASQQLHRHSNVNRRWDVSRHPGPAGASTAHTDAKPSPTLTGTCSGPSRAAARHRHAVFKRLPEGACTRVDLARLGPRAVRAKGCAHPNDSASAFTQTPSCSMNADREHAVEGD